MNNTSKLLHPPVSDYLAQTCVRQNPIAAELYQHTQQHMPHSQWLTSPEQAQFLALLVHMISAKQIVEVGVYTGHATLVMAQAMGSDGHLLACDKSDEWLTAGLQCWQRAGVKDQIELRIAPAIDTLQQLLDDGQAGSVDLIFIDADKIHYRDYYELALQLLRPGGVVVFDNALWIGEHTFTQASPATRSVHALNQFITQDERVHMSCLAVGSGMLVAYKRP